MPGVPPVQLCPGRCPVWWGCSNRLDLETLTWILTDHAQTSPKHTLNYLASKVLWRWVYSRALATATDHCIIRPPPVPKARFHIRDWEPMTITLQALSLVEKAEPVQVHFTLRLRDQWSMWMPDGHKVYMDSYMASNTSCFMGSYFQKPPLEGRSNTKPWDSSTPNAHKTVCLFWFIMFEDPHE
jgi:hypothetical protein